MKHTIVDECGLWWKQPPTRKFVASSSKHCKAGSKLLKDRCTILVGSNASGCHRIKPVMIWRSKNPRAFKHAKQPLPVIYRANAKSWMTAGIFTQWVKKIFRPEMKVLCQKKNMDFKILLIVDNCTGHPYIEDDNIKIVFLPPNTTSVLQPMDQG